MPTKKGSSRRSGLSPVWVRTYRKQIGYKPYSYEQRILSQDQRSFLASLMMRPETYKGEALTVYGYGAGRPITGREIKPLVRRGLIQDVEWARQQSDKRAKQVSFRLTEKGKQYGKAFHF